jgi:dTDP-L-rhamnose 4-epimerase
MKRALVTGGAGLVGSHLADLLLREGWSVRILDSLEPQTHPNGKPAWIPERAQFLHADVRDERALPTALEDIDVVFHQAAYGGFFPQLAKLCDVNITGTARLLETIREERLPVRKVVLASSQVVYREGSGRCRVHGIVAPHERSVGDLTNGEWNTHCPICYGLIASVPTREDVPIAGDTPYAVSKAAQERLALSWSRQSGIPVVALRYACTFGPRQSPFNPYTGIIAIFSTRILAGEAPIIYEDGEQTRDLCYVEDIARANLLAAESDAVDGEAVNVGSGRGTTIREVAESVATAFGSSIRPQASGEFRPGDLRHLVPDLTKIARTGYASAVSLTSGIERYVAWLRTQGDIADGFLAARERLREAGLVRRVLANGSVSHV